MKLALIAAIGKNRELGFQGDMPWKNSLKKDLAFFKQQTSGHAMVMGRKTFESLPGMLPGRKHIIISAQAARKNPSNDSPDEQYAERNGNLVIYPDLNTFLDAGKGHEETVFVIGGGSIYTQLLPLADELYLTEIDADFKADTWFPQFDPERYTQTILDEVDEGGYHYRHILYQKKPGPLADQTPCQPKES